jgi:protein-S-isoprenylcysteine O-methyltransferase Ste14
VRAVGLVVVVLGAALALRSAVLLAGRGRPRRGPRPALVLAGPYRHVRNPLLGGLVLASAGAALAARSRLVAAATLVAWFLAHLWVVRIEEPRLRSRFGAAYAEYLRCVPRWLPRGHDGGAT